MEETITVELDQLSIIHTSEAGITVQAEEVPEVPLGEYAILWGTRSLWRIDADGLPAQMTNIELTKEIEWTGGA